MMATVNTGNWRRSNDANERNDGHAIASIHTVSWTPSTHEPFARAPPACYGLGYLTISWNVRSATFSGGWRMRLSFGSGADLPLRFTAARRTDQPPRSGCVITKRKNG
ncbi:hypothetical protein KCP77_04075 [Salmonella enterica subsp. enterica]|nr:hypothetical protein KCP77_04075 [Salmonella enterica subsp. enterica]